CTTLGWNKDHFNVW
nr:immunoglobulin heavy chain junction region [Macaca mulatta]MOV54495.1 immunoglobulin heavy chain junction region [Macaca mulatta]MOV55004.1 immunoglobulin heavy chain junction region [Macaca mulatta]MOV55595.1 immunoglobulin heavy chain junction region [Macaca mulatta]MOV57058.1 immunoglobulin heavy chain junction region [Macaca mulatta]